MMSPCQKPHWGHVIKLFPIVNCCCCKYPCYWISSKNEKEGMGPVFSLALFIAVTGNLIS